MLKIILIATVCGIICFYLKTINSEIFSISLIASGIIIFIEAFSYLAETVEIISTIIEASGIDESTYKIIFKISGIGVLIEFGSNLLEDLELKSLSNKLTLAGKIIIISVSIPVINSLLTTIKNLLIL